MQTTIRSRLDDLEFVRQMVSALAHDRDLPESLVFDVNVVLDELLSNIIKYGYADTAVHEIHIALLADDKAIEIHIEDDGKAFDPFSAPEPDLGMPLAQRPIGGLGIHFVRKLMDSTHYERRGSRNFLILKKYITPAT